MICYCLALPCPELSGDPQLSRMGDMLCGNLEKLFEGAGEIRPSILHGDLWSGNIAGWNRTGTLPLQCVQPCERLA